MSSFSRTLLFVKPPYRYILGNVTRHSLKIRGSVDQAAGRTTTIQAGQDHLQRAAVTIPGHEAGTRQVRPKMANISAIVEYTPLLIGRPLRRFSGMAVTRRFCPTSRPLPVPPPAHSGA
ncbi:hypothetical protein GWK47_031444 [Chionoecetes opilio]|uniref:Uncharacterized protein n=1 Tax=Chionoecetes opilio TaxID=41210 RepID=A0A8J4YKD0_CHIOP|nr:hypothetical protein GWK47_031444 [Chionoecetes opilio]